jgi:hypothetical protein
MNQSHRDDAGICFSPFASSSARDSKFDPKFQPFSLCGFAAAFTGDSTGPPGIQ